MHISRVECEFCRWSAAAERIEENWAASLIVFILHIQTDLNVFNLHFPLRIYIIFVARLLSWSFVSLTMYSVRDIAEI